MLPAKLEKQFFHLALGLDRALASHPTARLDRWLGFARKHGDNQAAKDYYEKNARRIVTIWGPPVDDYAARLWSGLVRDYYVPRWKQYFESRKTGKALNLAAWEKDWVEQQKGLSSITPYPDMVNSCRQLIKKASAINESQINVVNGEVVGAWSPGDIATDWKELSWNIPAGLAKRAKSIRFEYIRGSNKLDIAEVWLEMDGREVCRVKQEGSAGTSSKNNGYALQVPAGATGNNSCVLKARVKSDGKAESFGNVILVPRK